LGTSAGGVDLLLESDDLPVVVVGAAVEILGQLSELVVEVLDKLVNGLEELLKGALRLEVHFGVGNDP
jgi:hypothetical protein